MSIRSNNFAWTLFLCVSILNNKKGHKYSIIWHGYNGCLNLAILRTMIPSTFIISYRTLSYIKASNICNKLCILYTLWFEGMSHFLNISFQEYDNNLFQNGIYLRHRMISYSYTWYELWFQQTSIAIHYIYTYIYFQSIRSIEGG